MLASDDLGENEAETRRECRRRCEDLSLVCVTQYIKVVWSSDVTFILLFVDVTAVESLS